ncbi:MAG TPA: hypothetical protein VF984_15435 [Actinomycetota bacterium]
MQLADVAQERRLGQRRVELLEERDRLRLVERQPPPPHRLRGMADDAVLMHVFDQLAACVEDRTNRPFSSMLPGFRRLRITSRGSG